MPLFGNPTVDASALPRMETSPAASAVRKKRETLDKKIEEMRQQFQRALQNKMDALTEREATPYREEAKRLGPELQALKDEMQTLRQRERELTAPDQATIAAWQAVYNALLRDHLTALTPSLLTLDALLRHTEQARQQRITLRGSHSGQGAIGVWITQMQQYLREEDRTP